MKYLAELSHGVIVLCLWYSMDCFRNSHHYNLVGSRS